jgi:hypothetical protein
VTSLARVPSPPTAICLACRTAVAAGARCDGGPRHRVVDLTGPPGREALLTAMWGPRSRREQLHAIARAGVAGSGFGAALEAAGCLAEGLDSVVLSLAVLVVCGGLFVAVQCVATLIANALRRRRLLRPRGASRLPKLVAGRETRYGIVEGEPLPSPLRDQGCVAYGISLRTARAAAGAGDVVWREAASFGFTLRLDDGSAVFVPPGRIHFDVDPKRAARATRERAAARLPADLGVEVGGELASLPFDQAFEEVLRPGDRVAVVGTVELREAPGAERPSLREAIPAVLVPTGTPVLVR